MVETADLGLICSKNKAISTFLLYAAQQEQNGHTEMLGTFLHVASTSGQEEFMWDHIEPHILMLLNRASPQTIVFLSPYIHWSSPTSISWVHPWETAVTVVPHTDEVIQSVVNTLLQIASVDFLQPLIPVTLWSWLNKQPSLPPICYGRSMGSSWDVVQMVRALGDIKTLKSYLLLIWSEWGYPHLHSPDQMYTLIQEDFSGIEMFNHREDLLQHLNHILAQLNLGLDLLQQHKPGLNQDDIQQMNEQYRGLKRVLLEVDSDATNMLLCEFCGITLLNLLTTMTRYKYRVPTNFYVCNSSPITIVMHPPTLLCYWHSED